MQRQNYGRFLKKTFFLLWIYVCLTLFMVYPGKISHIHQFIEIDWDSFSSNLFAVLSFDYLREMVFALVGVLLFSFVCISIGVFIFDLFGEWPCKRVNTSAELFAYIGTAFLLGQIVSSSVFLILGSYDRLTSGTVILFLVTAFLLSGYSLIRFIRSIYNGRHFQIFSESHSRFENILLSLIVAILFFSLLYSTARLSYDSVAMYFSDAKITALTNQVRFFPNDSFIVSSFHVGIQYTSIIQLFGDQAARLYSWIGGLVILVFSGAIGEQLGLSRRALLILLALFLTSTFFVDLLGDGKIDLLTSAPALAAIYWMIIGSHSNTQWGLYFLIGVLAGFSIISRPFNAFFCAILIGIFYIERTYSQRKKTGHWEIKYFFQPVLGIGVGVLILGFFHLLANWIILGSPFAPIENALLMEPSIWQWSFDPDDIWVFRILYPLVVTFINSPQSLGDISPLFVGFLPALLLPGIRNNVNFSKDLKFILTITLITLSLWLVSFFTVVEIRYVLFLWSIIFMPVAVLIERTLEKGDTIFRGILRFSLIGLLLFMNIRIIFISISTYSPIEKNGFPQCYDSPLCEFLRPLNQTVPVGERVLTMNAYRYYLRPDLFTCSTKAHEYLNLRDASKLSEDEFWNEVYRQGYHYIAYERNYSVRHLNIDIVPNPARTPGWIELHPISGKIDDDQVAYRIEVLNPPLQVKKTCRRNSSGIWDVEEID